MTLDDTPVVGVAVEEQQTVFPSQCDTSLVEQTVVQTDILALSLRRNLHHLKRLQRDIVRLRKGHHIRYQHRRTRRQSTHRQRALNHALDTTLQFETLLQCILCASGIVAPVALLHLRGGIDLEIHDALKRSRLQMYVAVIRRTPPQIHTFVDSKTRHQSVLVIYVRTQRTYPIRCKNMILIFVHACKSTTIFPHHQIYLAVYLV